MDKVSVEVVVALFMMELSLPNVIKPLKSALVVLLGLFCSAPKPLYPVPLSVMALLILLPAMSSDAPLKTVTGPVPSQVLTELIPLPLPARKMPLAMVVPPL